MGSFPDLPFELVEHILSYCRQAQLHSLALTSRTLNVLAEPFLYSNVDLRIRPTYVPRIDTFFFSVTKDPRRAKRITSLQLGPTPWGCKDGTRVLPGLTEPQKRELSQVLDELVSSEEWILRKVELPGVDLEVGYYGSFAALIICTVPSLRRLQISDHANTTLSPLLKVLRAASEPTVPNSPLHARLSSIEEISYNMDNDTGAQHSDDLSHVDLSAGFYLPGVHKVEFCAPQQRVGAIFGSHAGDRFANLGHIANNITTVTILRTRCISQILEELLRRAPRVVSLTCDMFVDHRKSPGDDDLVDTSWLIQTTWRTITPCINLWKWTESLRLVKSTLQKLVLSVEYCDMTKAFYEQNLVERQFTGCLNLVEFEHLHYLEVPVPFLTGDPVFSIAKTYSPNLPPNIRHLCLRTDMSYAQFAFSLDRSQELDYHESCKKAVYENKAKMDLSYIFQASQFFLDSALPLESITLWQPTDRPFQWVERQVIDLATACENKSVVGKMLWPQMFRLKSKEHWNLVKEVTLFDPAFPERGRFEQFLRGERSGGTPLGLAMHYHLRKFQEGEVQTRV